MLEPTIKKNLLVSVGSKICCEETFVIMVKRISILVTALAIFSGIVIGFPKSSVSMKVQNMLASVADVIDPTPTQFPTNKEIGVWLWRSPTSYNNDELEGMFSYAKKQGINTFYVNVGEYLDIQNIRDARERNTQLANYVKKVEQFNSRANSYGIAIHGLVGHATWTLDSQQYLPHSVLGFVLWYNKNHSKEFQFAGMQFDIEPYGRDDYNKDTANAIYTEFLDLASSLVKDVKDTNTPLVIGFTVPFWLDGQTNETVQSFAWHEHKSLHPVYHLLNILNQIPGGYIAIMDYRVTTTGRNGSIALAKNELDYARQYAPNTKVLVGQEASDIEPRSITFYGRTKRELKRAVNKILVAYSTNPNLKGFAIHHFESYQKLKE
jgi:hypothetical protein